MDGQILLWIQDNLRYDWLTSIMKFISFISNGGILWIVLAAILIFVKKTKREGITLAIGLILHVLTCNILVKNLVRRPRPYVEVDGLKSLIGNLSDYSFPSGHTTVMFMIAMVFVKKFPKHIGIIMYILAILTGFSRMYLGVHYPTDIIGGAVLGSLIGLFAVYIEERLVEKDKKKKVLKNN